MKQIIVGFAVLAVATILVLVVIRSENSPLHHLVPLADLMTTDNGIPDRLILERSDGQEVFPIIEASWHVRDEGTNDASLYLYLACGRSSEALADTKSLDAEPHWELVAIRPQLTRAKMAESMEFEIPDSSAPMERYYGAYTNFYYVSHEGTERNTIKILEIRGEQLLAEIHGECGDVNYYDGSKPPNRVTARAWFKHR